MRTVFSAFCLAGVLAAVVSATPLSRDKRFAGAYSAAGINPFGLVFGNPYVGAFAGTPFTGFGFGRGAVNPAPAFPFFQDYPSVIPVYIPKFPVFKNWYEGENVCKEEKILNSQLPEDVIPADWKDDLPSISTDYKHQQQSCQGTDKKYVCVERVVGKGGETQVKATKYECCHGFVRDPTGAPGCVESTLPNPSDAAQKSNVKLTSSDSTYYLYAGNNMPGSRSSSVDSSVDSSASENIDKVPLQ